MLLKLLRKSRNRARTNGGTATPAVRRLALPHSAAAPSTRSLRVNGQPHTVTVSPATPRAQRSRAGESWGGRDSGIDVDTCVLDSMDIEEPGGGAAVPGEEPVEMPPTHSPRRLAATLAYAAVAIAAGLCAAVFATDGEIFAMLLERARSGTAKGQLRVSAERRGAHASVERGGVTQGGHEERRLWPGGLPWLAGRLSGNTGGRVKQ